MVVDASNQRNENETTKTHSSHEEGHRHRREKRRRVNGRALGRSRHHHRGARTKQTLDSNLYSVKFDALQPENGDLRRDIILTDLKGRYRVPVYII